MDLELKYEVDERVAKKINVDVEQLQMNLAERESYYNEGANDMLDMIALYFLFTLDDEETKIKNKMLDLGYTEKSIGFNKSWFIFEQTGKEYFQLGFKTGFKKAIEMQRNAPTSQ